MKKVTNLLLAVMAVFVMTSCNEKKSFDALNGEWNVVAVGEMAIPDSADAFIGFNVAEQLIYGNAAKKQYSVSARGYFCKI